MIKMLFQRQNLGSVKNINKGYATIIPARYEHDWTNLTVNFAQSKISLIEKLIDGTVVTPTPAARISSSPFY